MLVYRILRRWTPGATRGEDVMPSCTGDCCEKITLKLELNLMALRGTDEDWQIVEMLEPTGWAYEDGAIEYACRNFDRETRLCRIYPPLAAVRLEA